MKEKLESTYSDSYNYVLPILKILLPMDIKNERKELIEMIDGYC